MAKRAVDKLEPHERDKRNELCWALSLQGYNTSEIGRIFGIKHRSTVMRIIKQKPRDWSPKWVRRD